MYLSELRQLAKDCEFGEYLQTALRDQLVCGLNSEALQGKVLAAADLTFREDFANITGIRSSETGG